LESDVVRYLVVNTPYCIARMHWEMKV